MIEQEQTTQTTDETSTSAESQGTQDQGSSTSTTEGTTQDRVDLGPDDETQQTTDKVDETDEQRAEREAREELFGAPAEGDTYALEGLPEGTVIDQEALDAVTPTFRELGLSNKGASKVAQVYAEKVLPGVAKQVTSKIEQDIVAQRSDWEGQARDMIAGKGEVAKNASGEPLAFASTDMKAVRATAAKALDKLAPQGFRQWLDETGLSVHPMMVAFAYQAGQLVAEDTEVHETDTSTNKKTSAATRRKAGGMDPTHFYGG